MRRQTVLATILLFSLFLLLSQPSFAANDNTMDSLSPSIAPSISPIITIENKEIQYDLPYPGVLPDNPFYFLKMIRDNIVSFFISDPGKKASYDLEQADKRINASLYLANEKPGNDDLISSTLTEAITFFDHAVSQIQQARQQGQDTKDFVAHMNTAAQKYHQVLLQLGTKASTKLKDNLDSDQQRLDTIQTEIKKMGKK